MTIRDSGDLIGRSLISDIVGSKPPRGALMRYVCDIYDLIAVYADGNGGFIHQVVARNHPKCGYESPVAKIATELVPPTVQFPAPAASKPAATLNPGPITGLPTITIPQFKLESNQ